MSGLTVRGRRAVSGLARLTMPGWLTMPGGLAMPRWLSMPRWLAVARWRAVARLAGLARSRWAGGLWGAVAGGALA
ncbi:hypothetical protein GCM10009850_107980 [Nonomuraea monospora]|uniref:Uncharacterized protein n=1 Tax=Nonomuraea monospora TaxID=568818 RepID=A0ABP5PYS2_9ACTN